MVGVIDGICVGIVGWSVGVSLGVPLGVSVGALFGEIDGICDGDFDGVIVGATVGTPVVTLYIIVITPKTHAGTSIVFVVNVTLYAPIDKAVGSITNFCQYDIVREMLHVVHEN